eukprot:8118984-Alexandrium_andersonii.AAC.1
MPPAPPVAPLPDPCAVMNPSSVRTAGNPSFQNIHWESTCPNGRDHAKRERRIWQPQLPTPE